jgi:hypothetical protein
MKVIIQTHCSVITEINAAFGMRRSGTIGMKVFFAICSSETENGM